MQKFIILITFVFLFAGPVLAAKEKLNESAGAVSDQGSPIVEMSGQESAPIPTVEEMTDESSEAVAAEEKLSQHGFGHKLLLYIPNRILDVFDFVRLRVRVGPGLAAGVRATRPLTLSIGGYTSIYAGLPGPRLKPTVKLPVGIENYAGMEASILDGSSGGRFAPNYSSTEIGVSVHPLIFGLDVCLDPLEVIDLALGFVFIDIRGDDL